MDGVYAGSIGRNVPTFSEGARHVVRVSIEISDDGRGFDGTPSMHGHGLDNMRKRAKVLGGDLQIEPNAAGTTLWLSLAIG